ncbi:uncharacterized protein LOC131319373 [Rhododendron vialii]|uniref:uncharacterized protein LOC131319373 n=1 Tax=Rhododendron vialii TaxID=182163 RepID=UPI0026600F41|nr:uncharacterized protein LOC131319373 [Rhododendron vialii]
MLLIQETKLESLERITVQKMWGNADFEFVCSNAMGTSGGLLCIWNRDFFKVDSVIVHRSFIQLQGVINTIFPCVVVNVYALNEVVHRRLVWEELLNIKANSSIPWCVWGDFNEIQAVNERLGCLRIVRDFVDFQNNMELIDLPMLGRKFTWTNFQDHAIHSRLDRFLVSIQWMENFKLIQRGLPRPIYDHCPRVLSKDGRDWGPKPFKFMDIWLSNPSCMKLAKTTWNECQVTGWADFIIMQKLKAVKAKLKVWNKEVFGDVALALQKSEADLHQFELLEEEKQLNEDDKAARCKIKSEFWRLSCLTESMWRQKSRIKWLKLGDKNTKFFQVMANNRFRRNMVGAIKANGRMLDSPREIKGAAMEYFSNNFKEERFGRPVLGGLFSIKLTPLDASSLEN